MTEKIAQDCKTAQRKKLDRRIDALGWGAFFVWTGIAVLADVGWGIGMIGMGLIIIGSMAAREYFAEPDECSGTTKANC
jgi:hypothetical protein